MKTKQKQQQNRRGVMIQPETLRKIENFINRDVENDEDFINIDDLTPTEVLRHCFEFSKTIGIDPPASHEKILKLTESSDGWSPQIHQQLKLYLTRVNNSAKKSTSTKKETSENQKKSQKTQSKLVDELKAKVRDLNEENQKKEAEIREKNSTISARENLIQALSGDVENERSKIENLEAKIAKLETERENLKKTIEDKEIEVCQHNERALALHEEMIFYREKCENLSKKMAGMISLEEVQVLTTAEKIQEITRREIEKSLKNFKIPKIDEATIEKIAREIAKSEIRKMPKPKTSKNGENLSGIFEKISGIGTRLNGIQKGMNRFSKKIRNHEERLRLVEDATIPQEYLKKRPNIKRKPKSKSEKSSREKALQSAISSGISRKSLKNLADKNVFILRKPTMIRKMSRNWAPLFASAEFSSLDSQGISRLAQTIASKLNSKKIDFVVVFSDSISHSLSYLLKNKFHAFENEKFIFIEDNFAEEESGETELKFFIDKIK